jgi:3-deoxy-7-phosphoheptulonate synthase
MGYHFSAVTLSVLRAARGRSENPMDIAIQPSSGIFTSHEALHLPLETSMTRRSYNTSAHMLWIGERTRSIGGAHFEYMRGLRNPVGIKVGPSASPAGIVELLDGLNPYKIVGKNVIITRLGWKNVKDKLPALVKAVQASGHVPVWLCDPCHGNTQTTPSKFKTRVVEDMLEELQMTYMVHTGQGSILGGIHLEETGEDDVTECIERSRVSLDNAEFPNFRSLCDPRLSRSQGIEFVRSFADFVRGHSARSKVDLALYNDNAGTYELLNDAPKIIAEEGVSATLKIRT